MLLSKSIMELFIGKDNKRKSKMKKTRIKRRIRRKPKSSSN